MLQVPLHDLGKWAKDDAESVPVESQAIDRTIDGCHCRCSWFRFKQRPFAEEFATFQFLDDLSAAVRRLRILYRYFNVATKNDIECFAFRALLDNNGPCPHQSATWLRIAYYIVLVYLVGMTPPRKLQRLLLVPKPSTTTAAERTPGTFRIQCVSQMSLS